MYTHTHTHIYIHFTPLLVLTGKSLTGKISLSYRFSPVKTAAIPINTFSILKCPVPYPSLCRSSEHPTPTFLSRPLAKLTLNAAAPLPSRA